MMEEDGNGLRVHLRVDGVSVRSLDVAPTPLLL